MSPLFRPEAPPRPALPPLSPAGTALLTSFVMVAFASNSVLCRAALHEESIDATSFTVLRLLAGALVLSLLQVQRRRPGGSPEPGRSWLAGGMLFLYAACFSYAYVTLDAGTGALTLFGAVQVTMILCSVLSGYRLSLVEWAGVAVAGSGFVWLVLPGATAPSPTGFGLMVIAGAAWGGYSLVGRHSARPLADTARNFLLTLPFAAGLAIIGPEELRLSAEGILLAVVSGGIASAPVYVAWYIALRGLRPVQAAVVQLSVPAIAAFGGILFLSEVLTPRLVLSTVLILGGILAVILGRQAAARPRQRRLR